MKALAIILLSACFTGGAGMGAEGKTLRPAFDEAPMECTFTIKGNFSGTVVDVQITVSDVSFVECTLLKIGVKKALK